MHDKNTISVIIPTHFRGERVKLAVDSVLSSSRPPDEIIVVEDKSSEAEISLKSHIDAGHVRYFKNTNVECGASSTRNFGVAKAKMEFITFLDDDDTIHPNYLMALDGAIDKQPMVWGFGDVKISSRESRSRARSSGILNKVPFKRKLCGMGSGFFIKREQYLKLGGLKTSQTIDEDTDFCCRLIAAGTNPYYIRKTAVLVERNDIENRLTNSTNFETAFKCYLQTLEDNYESFQTNAQAQDFLVDRVHRILCKNMSFDYLAFLGKYEISPTLRAVQLLRILRYKVLRSIQLSALG